MAADRKSLNREAIMPEPTPIYGGGGGGAHAKCKECGSELAVQTADSLTCRKCGAPWTGDRIDTVAMGIGGGAAGGSGPDGRIPDDITLGSWVPGGTSENGGDHVYGGEPERSRWAFFTAPRISLAGAIIYVMIGILIGTIS